MEFKSNLYVKVITPPGFQTAFSGVFSTAVDISDDEGGLAMDILFKPRVEATEQMAQNKNQESAKSHRNRIKESAKSHPRNMYNHCM